MITGEDVLEVLDKEHGVHFVGELHPFDRKKIEHALDYEIDMASSLSEDIDNAIDEFADAVIERLKERLSDECHSDVVDVVRDEQSSAKQR